MIHFYVLFWDFTQDKLIPYDIIPYLLTCYNKAENKPNSYNEFKKFILNESSYIWQSRCEYEILISDWPCKKSTKKIDIYDQIKMNIDVIVPLFINEVIAKI